MGLEKLNEFKKKRGLTNFQLSQMTGITISTIDKITSGNNTNPKLRTIEALCNALGCTLDDLVCDTNGSNEQNALGIIKKRDNNKQLELTKHEEKVIIAYRDKPEMQPAVDKLLGVEEIHTTPAIRAARSNDDKPIEVVERSEEKFIKAPPQKY